MASTYLTKTPSASNRKTFTISVWIKRSLITSQQAIFSTGNGNSGPLNFFGFGSSDNLNYWEYQDGYTEISDIKTTKVFRDINAWYHIVLAVDTTQATASNRTKIYVNGELQTDLGTSGSNQYPTSQNQDMAFNQADQHAIGRYEYNNSGLFDGCMSHFHFIDGTAYTASTFGSTDSTTGEWKINTSPSVSYGTNGFFLLKDNNGITDQSGNSNNYVVGGGTLTNLQDCPSNVFATMNPLTYNSATFFDANTNGNTTLNSKNTGNWGSQITTIGALSGKYYCEAKLQAQGSYAMIGICDMNVNPQQQDAGWYVGQTSAAGSPPEYGYYYDGLTYHQSSGTSFGNAYTTGDIIGIAMDLDNNKLYFSKNGTWQNSGDPTSGSTGTGSAYTLITGGFYGFAASGYANTIWQFNLGNGYFGTTAISSEGTNASNIGKFEYDVPANYTALSTKGLNE